MDTCLFPLCNRHPEKNGYCLLHGKHYANGSGEVKIPKAAKKESDSTKVTKKELKKLYPEFLSKHPVCEIKMKGCTVKATCVHHKHGRLKDNILNQKTWMASCSNCNLIVEIKDAEAREKGFKKSKFTTEK